MKTWIPIAAIAFAMGGSGTALAAPCKNAQGKIIKCPPKPAAKKLCKLGGKLKPCTVRARVTNPNARIGYKF